MVQYIVTPWRDHNELISVRSHLYPGGKPASSPSSGDTSDSLPWAAVYAVYSAPTSSPDVMSRAEADQRLAVGRVQMWAHRGNCPHLVESTGLLVAVVLDDVDQSRRRRSGVSASSSSDFAVRAAYATAFSRFIDWNNVPARGERTHATTTSGTAKLMNTFRVPLFARVNRFVTGLLDSQQDKQKKQSMYSLAKTIGLPATFVELRHQATHEQLPSLLKLRGAAKKALSWIWDFYWRDLTPAPAGDTSTDASGQDAVAGGIGMDLSAASEEVYQSVAPAGADDLAAEQQQQQLDPDSLPPMSCEEVLVAFMKGKLDEGTARAYLARHDEAFIIKTTDDIGNSTDDMRIMTRALRLVGAMIEGTCPLITRKPAVAAVVGGEKGMQRRGEEEGNGWVRRSRESWKPKPIGIV